LAVLGLIEVLKKYPHFRRIFHHLRELLKTEKPDLLILVDYPGFNVRFAKVAKKNKVPVLYYISPQVWAWAKWRRHLIAQRVQKMLVLFPFEKDFYRGTGLNVEYVGHPLVDTFPPLPPSEKKEKVIGLLPGSREHEVEQLFPLMLAAAQIIYKKEGGIRFLASAASPLLRQQMEQMAATAHLPLTILKESLPQIAQQSRVVMVASGTATLECALLATPMVMVYKVSFLTWLLARLVVRLPYIGLVNIVRGKKVVPELIQFQAKPEQVAQEVLSLLNSPDKSEKMKEELRQVGAALGEIGASRRAAQAVKTFLQETCKGLT
jgi:lipid-A-disaccharide synthase